MNSNIVVNLISDATAEVEPPGTGDGIRTWRLCEGPGDFFEGLDGLGFRVWGLGCRVVGFEFGGCQGLV